MATVTVCDICGSNDAETYSVVRKAADRFREMGVLDLCDRCLNKYVHASPKSGDDVALAEPES